MPLCVFRARSLNRFILNGCHSENQYIHFTFVKYLWSSVLSIKKYLRGNVWFYFASSGSLTVDQAVQTLHAIQTLAILNNWIIFITGDISLLRTIIFSGNEISYSSGNFQNLFEWITSFIFLAESKSYFNLRFYLHFYLHKGCVVLNTSYKAKAFENHLTN